MVGDGAIVASATFTAVTLFVWGPWATLNWMTSDLDGFSAKPLCDNQSYKALAHRSMIWIPVVSELFSPSDSAN